MKDLQVKDLKNYLSTRSPIRLVWESGEDRIAIIKDFDKYSNYYVTEIYRRSNEIILYIKSEI